MLHFLLGLVAIGAIIMMIASSPLFRAFIIIVILLAAAGIWTLIGNLPGRAGTRPSQPTQDPSAATAIKEADLTLSNVTLARHGLGEFVLRGTVTNDSDSRLSTIDFQVTLTDCQDSDCRVVGQGDVSASVSVPPKQMRSFGSAAIRFDDLPALGTAKRSWCYSITGLRAG